MIRWLLFSKAQGLVLLELSPNPPHAHRHTHTHTGVSTHSHTRITHTIPAALSAGKKREHSILFNQICSFRTGLASLFICVCVSVCVCVYVCGCVSGCASTEWSLEVRIRKVPELHSFLYYLSFSQCFCLWLPLMSHSRCQIGRASCRERV